MAETLNATASTIIANCLRKIWPLVQHAIVVGLILQGAVAAAQNLATNPGFETGDSSGWFPFGPCSIVAETGVVHSGNSAALVSGRTAYWNGIAQSFQGVLQSGQTYNISTWLMLAGGSNETMQLVMQKVDSSGTSYAIIASGSVSTNGWTQLSGQYAYNPSGAVSALNLYAQVFSSSNAAYFTDDWIVQQVIGTNGECTVDWTNVFQRIDGFGACSAWTAPTLSDAQADLFFSTNNGIGLSLLRNRVAPDGSTTELMTMQKAQARGALVWTTPMSPPAIYKDTNSVNGGHFVSSAANYQNYAGQLAAYVANMKNNGINLYALSIQNEPDISATYESCLWTAQQLHDFVPYLAAALTNAGVASTRILLPEDSNWNFDYDLANTTMNDSNTAAQVGIMAAHPYGAVATPLNSYGKPLWETEFSGFDAFDGSITNGIYWAGQIHAFMTVAQANAWHYYWLIPYDPDPNHPENLALTDDFGNPAKRMYVLGQYSRFVRPGYYRIGAINNGNTSVSAYKDPNSGSFAIVAVNFNSSDFAQTINLNGFAATNVTPWITSASLSLAPQPTVSVSNSTFLYTLPAMSVVTFVGKANASKPILAISRNGPQVGLTINGNSGWNYTLLTSTNLSNWQPLLLTNPAAMPMTWSDTNSISNTRFYRVQLGQ